MRSVSIAHSAWTRLPLYSNRHATPGTGNGAPARIRMRTGISVDTRSPSGGRPMIKDIVVNLSYGTSQDGVSNYALSVAETFGAHIVGTAFAYYPVMANGVGLSTNFIRAQQA